MVDLRPCHTLLRNWYADLYLAKTSFILHCALLWISNLQMDKIYFLLYCVLLWNAKALVWRWLKPILHFSCTIVICRWPKLLLHKTVLQYAVFTASVCTVCSVHCTPHCTNVHHVVHHVETIVDSIVDCKTLCLHIMAEPIHSSGTHFQECAWTL